MKKSISFQFIFRLANIAAILSVAIALAELSGLELRAQTTAAGHDHAPVLRPDQIDSLVAPIALYPDPLLSQILVASTYPIEIVQLQQWIAQNPTLRGQGLADAAQRQDWDPSIQAMSAFPDVVKRLADNIRWTTDLGNAFLSQEMDVMDAVQRMRIKAHSTGALKSTSQQVVETKVVEQKTVVVIQPANPQVIYVPVYNPVVVYGPPAYPYPPIYYPPPVYAGPPMTFGPGVSFGGWTGGWGWGFGWGQRTVIINNNNYYLRPRPGRPNYPPPPPPRGGHYPPGQPYHTWQHDPYHRGGVPYRDRSTERRFEGGRRGGPSAPPATRPGTPHPAPGTPNAPTGRPLSPDRSGTRPQAPNRPDRGTVHTQPAPNPPPAPNPQPAPNQPGPDKGGRPRGGDRVGDRKVPPASNPRNSGGAFGGAGGSDRSTEGSYSRRGSGSVQDSRDRGDTRNRGGKGQQKQGDKESWPKQ